MSDWAKGARFSPMAVATTLPPPRRWRPGPAATLVGGLGAALVLALAVIGPERLIAQIEGDRGIIPVASSSDIAITGIQVETTGNSPEEARLNGWREAQKLAWAKAGGPAMDVGVIESMVSAVVKAVETVDACAEAVVKAGLAHGSSFIIIADHGNADVMMNEDGSPNTAHSTNLVPCILVDNDFKPTLRDGKLGDVSPTILKLMGVAQPKEMTGVALF